MKLLTFQTHYFGWAPFSKTVPEAADVHNGGRVDDAVVVFLHIEERDDDEARAKGVFKKVLKHIKWIANKGDYKNVVLHSFTHLGGQNATPAFALDFMHRLSERLTTTGYLVSITPFGYFCSWDISVRGESLAKVWKEI